MAEESKKETVENKDGEELDISTKAAIPKRTRKKPEPDNSVIWLYAAHPRLVVRALGRIMDFGSQPALDFRESLGMSLQQALLPVHPYPANTRLKLIEQLSPLEGTSIIILGLPTDQDREELHKLYSGKAVWIHPPERQFHIDMAPVSASITFQEAEKRMHEWEDFLKEHLEQVHILRV